MVNRVKVQSFCFAKFHALLKSSKRKKGVLEYIYLYIYIYIYVCVCVCV